MCVCKVHRTDKGEPSKVTHKPSFCASAQLGGQRCSGLWTRPNKPQEPETPTAQWWPPGPKGQCQVHVTSGTCKSLLSSLRNTVPVTSTGKCAVRPRCSAPAWASRGEGHPGQPASRRPGPRARTQGQKPHRCPDWL